MPFFDAATTAFTRIATFSPEVVMRPLKLLPLILVLTSSMLWCVPPPAQACKEGPTSALAPGELSVGMRLIQCETSQNCETPNPPDCQLNGNPPFIRDDSSILEPNSHIPASVCFAVVRDPSDGVHYLFETFDGFKRYKSFDGGVTWETSAVEPQNVTISYTGSSGSQWWRAVQCPDVHFDVSGDGGNMTLYFSGKTSIPQTPDVFNIGRAHSADKGLSWQVTQPAVVSDNNGDYFPHQPSVIHLQSDEYLMAYTQMCKGALPNSWERSKILFQRSIDGGLTWAPYGGSVTPTQCDNDAAEWIDDGSVNRPRLVKDPAYSYVGNPKIHMFYSVYDSDGSKATRDCGRIGHAISTNNGSTWRKQTPVFESNTGDYWDRNQVLKPSLVVEPNDKLRLFYEGADGVLPPAGVGGLGIANASWPFLAAQLALQEEPAPEDEGTLARLTSIPNPTRGTTTIEIDLSRPRVAGEAELTIIDVTGRLVRQLWTGSSLSAPSSIEWDGRESSGARVAPGKYLARMRLGDETAGTHWITMTR